MAHGDIAAAAGIPPVPPTDLVKDGYDQINRALDAIVTEDNKVKARVTPLANGGTGADNAGAALVNLHGWLNSGAIAPGYSPRLGWAGGRLQYEIPGYAYPALLANYTDVTALVERVEQLVARVAELEARLP